MVCPGCQARSESGDRYCRQCGVRLLDPSEPKDAASGTGRHQDLLRQAHEALDTGELQVALERVQEALTLEPLSAAGHATLASVYERRGLHKEALQQYELAIQLNPASSDPERLELLRRLAVGGPRAHRRLPPWAAPAAVALTGVALVVAAATMLMLDWKEGQTPAGSTARSADLPPVARAGSSTVPPPATANGATPGSNAGPGSAAHPPAPQASAPWSAGPSTLPAVPVPPTVSQGQQGAVPQLPGATRFSAPAASGITAAAPGEVVPAYPAQPGEPPEASASGPAEQAPVGNGEAGERGRQPTGELPEPLTGFIRVQGGEDRGSRGATDGQPQAVRVPTAPQPPPRISVRLGEGSLPGGREPAHPGAEDEAVMRAARQVERQGYAALQRGDRDAAARLYRQAEQQYSALAVRGGPTAARAAEDARVCRQVLETLR